MKGQAGISQYLSCVHKTDTGTLLLAPTESNGNGHYRRLPLHNVDDIMVNDGRSIGTDAVIRIRDSSEEK